MKCWDQGSVLGLIPHNLYATPLTIITQSSLSPFLYADDTQLFISFVQKEHSCCGISIWDHYYFNLLLDYCQSSNHKSISNRIHAYRFSSITLKITQPFTFPSFCPLYPAIYIVRNFGFNFYFSLSFVKCKLWTLVFSSSMTSAVLVVLFTSTLPPLLARPSLILV